MVPLEGMALEGVEDVAGGRGQRTGADGRGGEGWWRVAMAEGLGPVGLSDGKVSGTVLWKPQSFFW